MTRRFIEVKTVPAAAELQRANARLLATLQPENTTEKIVKDLMATGQRYAIRVTVKDTGALSRSHLVDIERGRRMIRGTLYIAPNVYNPKSREYTRLYGPIVHDSKNKDRRFYERTFYDHVDPQARDHMRRLGSMIRWR